MSATTGRWVLAGGVIIMMVVTFLLLFWTGRGGAIHPDTKLNAIGQLIAVYLPMLTVMAAFYFGERADKRDSRARTPGGAFSVAATLIALWALLPSILILSSNTIEEALRFLTAFHPLGQSLGNGAVAFYFASGRQ